MHISRLFDMFQDDSYRVSMSEISPYTGPDKVAKKNPTYKTKVTHLVLI